MNRRNVGLVIAGLLTVSSVVGCQSPYRADQGALLGGIMLGVIESVASYVIGGGWADGISYAAFLLLLMLRPQGLFGSSMTKA